LDNESVPLNDGSVTRKLHKGSVTRKLKCPTQPRILIKKEQAMLEEHKTMR
jgi:hypothetical protein